MAKKKVGSSMSGKGAINKKTFPLIDSLCKLNDSEQQSVIKYLNKEGREAIYECVANCIYGTSISKLKRTELKEKLGSKKKVYKYLARAANNPARKRKLLSQTGGGLPLILATVLPFLATLFTK
jgi:hypothetical protein